VVLPDAWLGDPLPPSVRPLVVERVGCDQDPVDVSTTDGRLRLTSYVWPDQTARLDLLRGGFQLVAEHPVTVVRGDLVAHLEGLELREGTALVLWHSSVWLYLDETERAAAAVAIERLAARATPSTPVVQASREYLGEALGTSFPLVLRWWPAPPDVDGVRAGEPLRYADSPPHGLPVTWHRPIPVL
jgi:hypothetical protein